MIAIEQTKKPAGVLSPTGFRFNLTTIDSFDRYKIPNRVTDSMDAWARPWEIDKNLWQAHRVAAFCE